MQKIIIILIYALFLCLFSTGLNAKDNPDTVIKLDCLKCHTCDKPSAKNQCLKPCPTSTMPKIGAKHNLSEAPDLFVIKQLKDQYEPVQFNHRLHADMAQMGNSCQTCHHYSPPGKIPPCNECHTKEINQANLKKPSLKAAYHRQCLACHREWSHDTECNRCHLPHDAAKLAASYKDKSDIVGIKHPEIRIPQTKTFKTPYKPGPLVTFRHDEHISPFGLKCVDCHKKENCGSCHDTIKAVRPVKTQEEVHAICNDCHKQDECSKCHDTKEKSPFSHLKTGWALNRYHQNLKCTACHTARQKIARVTTRCSDCHATWTKDNFKHIAVGLQLDDMHSQFECSQCHADNNYEKEPVCKDCHADGRKHAEKPPGKYLKK
jgi:predicted CXXCH cytochrome family protein